MDETLAGEWSITFDGPGNTVNLSLIAHDERSRMTVQFMDSENLLALIAAAQALAPALKSTEHAIRRSDP